MLRKLKTHELHKGVELKQTRLSNLVKITEATIQKMKKEKGSAEKTRTRTICDIQLGTLNAFGFRQLVINSNNSRT